MKVSADKLITLNETKTLFKAFDRAVNAGDKNAIVDRMLFNVLRLAGLRISEALSLKWADIHDDFLVVHDTKSGNKKETVIIGRRLKEKLEEFKEINPYKKDKRGNDNPYLFYTQKGRMGRTSAHDRLKYWLMVAKLRPTISCHSFRHAYVTSILNAGLPLTVARDQARHKSISTTSVYLHFTEENKEKIKELF